MLKNGALIAVILSVFVLGMSIFLGSLLIQQLKTEPQLASVDLPILDGDDSDFAISLNPTDEQPEEIIVGDTAEIIVIDMTDEPASDSSKESDITNPPVQEAKKVDSSSMSKVIPVEPSKSSETSGVEYWVQAGSFSTLTRATAAAQALKDLGLSGSIETVEHQGRVLYRLRFGAWENLAEAERFRDYLRNQKNLREAFLERGVFDRSSDFVDAYVVQRGGK